VRRVLVPVALLLASLLASPAAAHLPACPAFHDPAADDRNADLRSFEDPALDILWASVGVKGLDLVVTLKLRSLSEPHWAEGVQYAGGFHYTSLAAGAVRDVEVFWTLAKSNPYTRSVLALQGIRVDHSYVLDTNNRVQMSLDRPHGTITLRAPMSEISRALEEKLTGTGRDVHASTAGNYVVFGEPYDWATTMTPLHLSGCR
jgi:hypothetical protein